MKVTEVKIRKLLKDGNKRALVSITIDGVLAVHDLTVIETTHFFVSFPSKKDENGEYRNIVHPIDKHTRMSIEGAVLKEYSRVVNGKLASNNGSS